MLTFFNILTLSFGRIHVHLLRFVFTYLLIIISFFGFSIDQHKADSLNTILSSEINDSTRIEVLNKLFIVYAFEDPNTAVGYASQALNLAQQTNNIEGKANSHHLLGYVHYIQGSYNEALQQWMSALKYRQQIGNKEDISQSLGNIGIIYKLQGNITAALSYYLQALKMDEELGNESGVARHLSNIGVIYWTQNEGEKALDFYQRALDKYKTINDESGMAFCYGNMGLIFTEQNDFDKALFHLQESLEIDLRLGKMKDVARHYGNIGLVYEKEQNYDRALEYFFKDLEIDKKLGSLKSISASSGNIGSAYLQLKKYDLAEKYLKSAAQLSDSLQLYKQIKDHQFLLSDLYTNLKKPDKALFHYKKYVAAKDSLVNEKNTENIVKQQMEFNFSKIHLKDSLEFAKQQAIKDLRINEQQARIEKERMEKYLLFGGTALVLIFALVFYQKLKQTRLQKLIIEEQKEKVEKQKDTISAHNKEILDSINYAKLIQQAILKSEEHVSEHLPTHFILFKPKDIVSGDFYWAHEHKEYLYIAVADCTGHGVPGAMMSMLGISFLTEIISHESTLLPNQILEKLRDRIINELNQNNNVQSSKDGMDIALVRINLETLTIDFSGANNPLWIVRAENSNELEEIKADKQPIGIYSRMVPFNNHNVQLSKGDSIYIFSDGFADQFGGEKGKKYKYNRFKEFLISNIDKDMSSQKQLIEQEFETWKSEYVQVDDVCVMGMKL